MESWSLTRKRTKDKVINLQSTDTTVCLKLQHLEIQEIKALKKLFLADKTTPELCSIGKCKAIYSFTPEHDDELALNEGK